MKEIHIIGVPSDYGQNRRGVDMGPSAIRYAGLKEKLERLGYRVRDLGDVMVPTPETRHIEHQKLKYLKEVVSVCEALAERVRDAVGSGYTPVILGGDHSIAMGSLAGMAAAKKQFGVIWFDAHGDMNTDETTPSGNIHGMPLAASIGIGHEALTGLFGIRPKVQPENVVLVGARSIDPPEAELIRQSGVHVFTMADIDRMGMDAVMRKAIELAATGTDGIHLSLDLDGLDPMFAPGVGTPVNGGVTYREGHLAMELLSESGTLLSVDVVEVNPILDHRNQTGRMAVELVESLFGKRVL
ncbi:arginase [Alicyclobacillus hesperidum URH17-3-68]|uniref:Arginase n=1 Tax=Alicyclobacillus hesperidum TaxID=89784 RepID=A0A1H2UQB6_9BACL|nr:arginase [Alicyclobacillus hesperidum]EJY56566.1 arginase [Alicyclobacillus hesperidum URH17-3-68]GLV14341.1 arginase [Alicyclobacillus hesperidum]SDW57754.1 arginase [Alicyclobacillus hesperidum]